MVRLSINHWSTFELPNFHFSPPATTTSLQTTSPRQIPTTHFLPPDGEGIFLHSLMRWRQMQLNALLTSAGINVIMCVLFLSLYSVLRKQPGNMYVYFGRKLAQNNANNRGSFSFERLVPSLGWMAKAWGHTDDDILSVAGLDAVVFIRIIVFR